MTLLAGVQVGGAGAQVTGGSAGANGAAGTTGASTTTPRPTTTVPPTTAAPATTTPAGETKLIVVPPSTAPGPAPPAAETTTTTKNPAPAPAADAPQLSNGQVDRILRSMERSGASSTAVLVEALKPLEAVGMTTQDALALGMGRFPLQGLANWTDDWLDFRAGPPEHQHMGNDLFAAFDVPVRAPADGTVRFEDSGLGGKAAYVTTSDGTYYYMAHLSGFPPGLRSGAAVKQGQVVGFNGDSGNARGGAPHVHLQIHPRGGAAVNPKPILDAWVAEALARVPELIASYKPAAAGAASEEGVPRILVATGLTRRFSVPDRPAAGPADFDSAVLGSPLLDPAAPEG